MKWCESTRMGIFMLRRKLTMNQRKFMDDKESNPMDGLANLADVMLVLACGLMLSLIVAWNVDVGNSSLVGLPSDTTLTEVEDEQTEAVNDKLNEELYEEYGVVYRDSETGKMYIITDPSMEK